MASGIKIWSLAPVVVCAALLACTTANGDGPLSFSYYDRTCPGVQNVVRSVMAWTVHNRPSMAPAVLRLFFHDCFVNGCDASVLLDSTDSMESDKDSNVNDSLAGFDVIDAIKSRLELACPGTVSCADVLALASRDAVGLLGGPSWAVPLGRKDARLANRSAAEAYLPAPNSTVAELIGVFAAHGLDGRDLVALSGAHTIGTARCHHYRARVYQYDGEGGEVIDPEFAAARRRTCEAGGDAAEAPFDEESPMKFDNEYYRDLVARKGLLTSDQALYGSGGPFDGLVRLYSEDGEAFSRDFAMAMLKMGNIPPPPGMPVEVRRDCRRINYY